VCQRLLTSDWDSKANGHNAVLWAPSFMLCDFGGLEEIVVRWLSVPVGTYLLMGCLDQDYTQDATKFINHGSWTSMLASTLIIFRLMRKTDHIWELECLIPAIMLQLRDNGLLDFLRFTLEVERRLTSLVRDSLGCWNGP
jgi:hypothetical protein